ncbi:MAG: hypothetical protein DA405_12350 [Bacteroidetes bacterium]|nr:MAG: hypothetical protein DA405_12350 [Bacteroidota bacterium]
MKQILIILSLTFLSCQKNVNTNLVNFEKTIFDLSEPKDSLRFAAWQKTYLPNKAQRIVDTLFSQDSIPIGELYYSDDQFLVYGYCMGEFGGALMF